MTLISRNPVSSNDRNEISVFALVFCWICCLVKNKTFLSPSVINIMQSPSNYAPVQNSNSKHARIILNADSISPCLISSSSVSIVWVADKTLFLLPGIFYVDSLEGKNKKSFRLYFFGLSSKTWWHRYIRLWSVGMRNQLAFFAKYIASNGGVYVIPLSRRPLYHYFQFQATRIIFVNYSVWEIHLKKCVYIYRLSCVDIRSHTL